MVGMRWRVSGLYDRQGRRTRVDPHHGPRLRDHRIRVNTVVPGWIMTERQKELWVTPEALAKQIDRQCLPDAIDPIYVARMVLFLASDDSAMCSAGNFMVEGGSI